MNKDVVTTQNEEVEPIRVKAYDFENGFRVQAEHMYRLLCHEQFTVKWCQSEHLAGMAMDIPENEVGQLRLFQKTNPARWGNPPTETTEAPNGNESKTMEMGQALVDEVLREVGLTGSGWDQSTATPDWKNTAVVVGDRSISIAVSSAGVVQVNRDPFTPTIELDEFYRRYPEIHLDKTDDGKWNFRHDDNDSHPDRDYWAYGAFDTEELAMAGALDQYCHDEIPNREMNITKRAILFSIEVAIHSNLSSATDDSEPAIALQMMHGDIKDKLVELNATNLGDEELERVFGMDDASESFINQARLAREMGVTMDAIIRENELTRSRMAAEKQEREMDYPDLDRSR